MKNLKLMICDLDGTLVNKGEDILPKTKEALIQLHKQNVLLGLASGRPVEHRLIDKFKKEWGLDFNPDVIIGFNGCEIWDNKTNITKRYDLLRKEDIKSILDFMWDTDSNAVLFENGYDCVYAKRYDDELLDSKVRNNSNVVIVDKEKFYEHDVCKIEFHYDDAYEKELLEIINKNKSDNYAIIKSFTGTIEFQNKNVSKGRALEIYCQENNINLNDVLACGDMDNDISLFEKAKTSICLLNGSTKAKEKATYITEEDVNNDGLGKYLFKYFLN